MEPPTPTTTVFPSRGLAGPAPFLAIRPPLVLLAALPAFRLVVQHAFPLELALPDLLEGHVDQVLVVRLDEPRGALDQLLHALLDQHRELEPPAELLRQAVDFRLVHH